MNRNTRTALQLALAVGLLLLAAIPSQAVALVSLLLLAVFTGVSMTAPGQRCASGSPWMPSEPPKACV